VESVVNPDPLRGVTEMLITGIVREGRPFNPVLELRRTIRSPLGGNEIIIQDHFTNRGNAASPHAWLLHINLGYPLVEPGADLVFAGRVMPRPDSAEYFRKEDFRVVPEPRDDHRGSGESVCYVDPKADRAGIVRVGVANRRRGLGLRISFRKKQFPRFVFWQHWGPQGQFVLGIEPANCGVEGRHLDRQRGWMDQLEPGESRSYEARIEVLDGPEALRTFRP